MNIQHIQMLLIIERYQLHSRRVGSLFVLKKKECDYDLRVFQDLSEGFYFRIKQNSSDDDRAYFYDYAFDEPSLAKSAHCYIFSLEENLTKKQIKARAYKGLDCYMDVIENIKETFKL